MPAIGPSAWPIATSTCQLVTPDEENACYGEALRKVFVQVARLGSDNHRDG